jgi:thymidylate synthase (FAD)
MDNTQVQVLDFGYIKVIESWGSDERIIEAARMSTDKGFLGWVRLIRCLKCGKEWECENKPAYCNWGECANSPTEEVHSGDARLLSYLYKNAHSTPFEFAGMVIEIQAPIMVFREWQRHRTQSSAEMSARYTPLPDFSYMPTVERCLMVNAANRQAGAVKGANEVTHESALIWLERLAWVYAEAERVYQLGLQMGIPKEVARLPVPVGRYSRMRAQANLRNWLAFMTLRTTYKGPNAQYEIRQFADPLAGFIQERFPRTYELFITA